MLRCASSEVLSKAIFVPYFGYILDDTALVLQKYSSGVPAAVGEAFPDFCTSTTKMAMF